MFKSMRQHHPYLYVLLVMLAVACCLLVLTLLGQACVPPAPPQANGDATTPPPAPAVEVVAVEMGGAARAAAELRVMGERLSVTLEADANTRADAPCVKVALRYGVLAASTDYPQGCAQPLEKIEQLPAPY